MTKAAAVAVCRGVEKRTGKRLDIRRVNDLMLDGKKVCGILTQAEAELESGLLESVVVGIGLNLVEPEGGYPPELKDEVGPLFLPGEKPGASASQLAAEIACQLLAAWERQDFLGEYESRALPL